VRHLDTNFSRDLQRHGWNHALEKYFLHSASSTYAHCQKLKPTLQTKTILIPFHVHDSHWVAIARRRVNGRTYFLYSDDMNSPQTEELLKSQFSSKHTSSDFYPNDTTVKDQANVVISPEDINSCDPDFITWNLNVHNVFISKLELTSSSLCYGGYFGCLKEPIIILKHYDPLNFFQPTFLKVIYPGIMQQAKKRCCSVFCEGIIPALQSHGIQPHNFPVCYKDGTNSFMNYWKNIC
jgi:hypothetical protein